MEYTDTMFEAMNIFARSTDISCSRWLGLMPELYPDREHYRSLPREWPDVGSARRRILTRKQADELHAKCTEAMAMLRRDRSIFGELVDPYQRYLFDEYESICRVQVRIVETLVLDGRLDIAHDDAMAYAAFVMLLYKNTLDRIADDIGWVQPVKERDIRIVHYYDMPSLADIYAPAVANGATSFELTPPNSSDFSSRIHEHRKTHPWLVFERNGDVVENTPVAGLRTKW